MKYLFMGLVLCVSALLVGFAPMPDDECDFEITSITADPDPMVAGMPAVNEYTISASVNSTCSHADIRTRYWCTVMPSGLFPPSYSTVAITVLGAGASDTISIPMDYEGGLCVVHAEIFCRACHHLATGYQGFDITN